RDQRFVTSDRASEVFELPPWLEDPAAYEVREVARAIDLQGPVVPPPIRKADLVRDLGGLLERPGARLGIHPREAREIRVEAAFDGLDRRPRPCPVGESEGFPDERLAQRFAEHLIGRSHAPLPAWQKPLRSRQHGGEAEVLVDEP